MGADGLYGNSSWFRRQLDELEVLYVVEVHKDQSVYTEPPVLYLPQKQGERGVIPVAIRQISERTKCRNFVYPLVLRNGCRFGYTKQVKEIWFAGL